MKQDDTMKQCHLTRLGAEGQEHYYCWLPKSRARRNKIVDIEGVGKGWRVESTWTELPTAVVLDRSQDYKKQRKASDI